ncbi:MAG: ATP-binding protein, partial [Pseudomonadota bacterium]
LLTFAMMFAVGLLISGLTLRIRRQASDARAREERTAALYSLSRDLGSVLDQEQAALVIAQHASELFGGGAAVLMPDGRGSVAPRAQSGVDVTLEAEEMSAARWAFEHGRLAGQGTNIVPGARVICVPLRSGLGIESLGVLALVPTGRFPDRREPYVQAPVLGVEQRHFLDAFARQAALALERARLAEEAKAAALRARTEEMRSSLLSAVSHDLRTPLAAITGAATTLRDGTATVSPGQRAELLDAICEEADRLERLVRNLLDMTQLESGALQVKREWVPIEEVVGSALARVEGRLAGRPIAIDLPPDLPLVSIDPVLLEQVLVNLLENARKYTPAGSQIDIRAHPGAGAVLVEVADRGPGIGAGDESRIFEKFFRGPKTVGIPGAGLGLAICKGIVEAHGGTLTAASREGGGSLFRVTLPFGGRPPMVPKEDEREDTREQKESSPP